MHRYITTGATSLFAVSLALPIDVKLSAIFCVLVIIASHFYTRARELLLPLSIALLFASFVTSNYTYVYSTQNWYLGTMNLFPLVMWTGGLLLTRDIFLIIKARVRYPLVASLFLYWIILFILEYVGYYWAGIQTTAGHPSFLGLGVLHGPPLLHFFYPTAGPIFIIVTHYLELWLRPTEKSVE